MKYLVTGGAGYLGKKLIKRLLDQGQTDIKVVSRNECENIKLKEKFPFIEIVTGDLVDPFVCEKACLEVGGIYHLAAFKHVGLAEENVRQCVSSNVIGTMNLLEATRKNKPEFIIGISTDKAAQVKGIYGATKLVMEGLFREYEKVNPDTKYRTVRYGNVWRSTGSFIEKWEEKMKKGEEVILTDPEASRFFWTVDEAVDLIFECLDKATDSKPFVPKMKAVKMGTVLEACMEVYGQCPVKIIGLQPGENKIETTDGVTFSDQVEQFSRTEFIEKFLK